MTSHIKDMPTGCKPRCRQGVHVRDGEEAREGPILCDVIYVGPFNC